MSKTKIAKTHTLRLSHNWDADPKKKALVCIEGDSLTFSVAALENVDCRGCGAEVPFSVYKTHRGRWSKASSRLHWVVDKMLNEVIAPCACVRCETRRRHLGNYDGLTREGLAESEA